MAQERLKKLGLMELKNNPMAKQQQVEASIQTKKRAKNPAYIFIFYYRQTNETMFESNAYSSRSNAKRGAFRYAKRNNMKIVLWVK